MRFPLCLRNLFLVLCLFSLISCVKDVDLERSREITIGPTVVMDLLSIDFSPDYIPAQEQPVMLDYEIDLEFLPNDIGDNLERLVLNFDYENSLSRSLTTKLLFYSGNSRIHELEFHIDEGDVIHPEVSSFPALLEGADLDKVLRSSRAVMQLEIQPGPAADAGKLRLKTRAFYKFNF